MHGPMNIKLEIHRHFQEVVPMSSGGFYVPHGEDYEMICDFDVSGQCVGPIFSLNFMHPFVLTGKNKSRLTAVKNTTL